MKKIVLVMVAAVLFGCGGSKGDDNSAVVVQEVEQVANYTYLQVKGKGPAYWIAVPSMQAEVGERYTYQGGLTMEDFHSEELDRTFERILFVDALFSVSGSSQDAVQDVTPGSTTDNERRSVEVTRQEGTVTIAELYADPSAYENRKVRVTGEVVKFNEAIMDRNWVHLQDGTEHDGKFDLTVTTDESFSIGNTIVMEGTLSLDKDFGYGYEYEILLEKATAVE